MAKEQGDFSEREIELLTDLHFVGEGGEGPVITPEGTAFLKAAEEIRQGFRNEFSADVGSEFQDLNIPIEVAAQDRPVEELTRAEEAILPQLKTARTLQANADLPHWKSGEPESMTIKADFTSEGLSVSISSMKDPENSVTHLQFSARDISVRFSEPYHESTLFFSRGSQSGIDAASARGIGMVLRGCQALLGAQQQK